jgi:hypothetical protein
MTRHLSNPSGWRQERPLTPVPSPCNLAKARLPSKGAKSASGFGRGEGNAFSTGSYPLPSRERVARKAGRVRGASS